MDATSLVRGGRMDDHQKQMRQYFTETKINKIHWVIYSTLWNVSGCTWSWKPRGLLRTLTEQSLNLGHLQVWEDCRGQLGTQKWSHRRSGRREFWEHATEKSNATNIVLIHFGQEDTIFWTLNEQLFFFTVVGPKVRLYWADIKGGGREEREKLELVWMWFRRKL